MDLLDYNLITYIGKGMMFGELGIIYNRLRCATVVAMEDVEVAVMERDDYDESLRDIMTYEENI